MENIATPKHVRRLVILAGIFLLISLILTGFNAYTTFAAPNYSTYVPEVVGFEGQLADDTGQPVSDGNYTITFSLYSQATGSTALWNETQTVPVTDGLYSVQLGTTNALDPSDFQADRWLGVQVSGDSEMTPRIPISAVPFALNARQAMGLQGNDVSSTAPDDKDVLTWDDSSSLWVPDVPGARTFPEITAVDNNENPQNFFAEYRNSITLRRIDNNTVEVSPGEVMIDGLMRRRTSSLTIAFSGTSSGPNRGLDTGTAQPNTTYFVYAVADDDEDSFDLIISANANAPTGVTHFRIVGQFATNGSTYIGNVTTLDPGATTQPQRIAFVNNDTQSSPVILTTIPGGMLGTDRVITVDILYEIMTASSGNEGKTWIYFKYGGQDARCQSKVTGSNNTWFAGVARVTLWANDATNAQKMLIECSGGQTSVDDLTVDSSSDQVLEVTWSVTSGSFKHLATLVSGPD